MIRDRKPPVSPSITSSNSNLLPHHPVPSSISFHLVRYHHQSFDFIPPTKLTSPVWFGNDMVRSDQLGLLFNKEQFQITSSVEPSNIKLPDDNRLPSIPPDTLNLPDNDKSLFENVIPCWDKKFLCHHP